MWKYCRVDTTMTSFSNPITTLTDAQDHINLIRDTLGLSNSVSMSCKPQDMDRTKIETLDIVPDLTAQQITDLIVLYPELDGKEV